jgi:hypothetical protein
MALPDVTAKGIKTIIESRRSPQKNGDGVSEFCPISSSYSAIECGEFGLEIRGVPEPERREKACSTEYVF